MPDIAIVIVTYNSEHEIGPCLDAVMASGADVVVVDNASADGTIGEIARRGVRLIANPDNRGFAAAVNQGFAACESPYVLVLNPDAVLERGLDDLKAACDLPGAAGAGGCLLHTNGNPQIGFMVRRLPTAAALTMEILLLNRLWPGNPVNRKYRCLDLDYSRTFAVEQPAGAFLMLRRAVWKELGGFDERFFPLWFEDVDFCSRLRNRRYLLFYVPQAVAKHTGGHSIPKLSLEMRHFYWYRSLLRYAAGQFSPAALRVISFTVIAGSILRIIAESVGHLSLRPIASYSHVVRLAARYLLYGRRGEVV
jgi:GT2 family glycosyltransferase